MPAPTAGVKRGADEAGESTGPDGAGARVKVSGGAVAVGDDPAKHLAAERAALLECVAGVCRRKVDAGVCATALAMFATYEEVVALTRERLQTYQFKQAYKLLEELWICAMQTDAAAVLDDPFTQLLLSDRIDSIEASWDKQFKRTLPWEEVAGVYEAAVAAVGAATVQLPDETVPAADIFSSGTFDVAVMTGAEVMARGKVVWNEANDTFDAKARKAIIDKFKGEVLRWSYKGVPLLTRPLIPGDDAALKARARDEPLSLGIHSLVYGSMFVTGQAMGLAPRFHTRIHQHAWARPEGCLTIEMFAHMVNRRSAPHPFLSMIPVADGRDSIGRAQDFDMVAFVTRLGATARPGVIMCNPPYVEAVMDRDLPLVLAALDSAEGRGVSLTVALLLPDWLDNTGVGLIVRSSHLRSHWHLKKKRHMACLENGSEVVMGVGQRLCLLSTDASAAFDDALWSAIAVDPRITPTVPSDCKVK